MKAGLDEIVCIIDASGSMENGKDKEAVIGFNNFIAEQRKLVDRTANVSVTLFDHKNKFLCKSVSIDKVPNLVLGKNYVPGGMTALYDAIGKTIDAVGKRLSETPEEDRPENVIVVILTDGEENSSRIYSGSVISEMVTHQTEVYSWQFIYLGVGLDDFAKTTAQSMGIAANFAYAMKDDEEGIGSGMSVTTQSVSLMRNKSYSKSAVFGSLSDEAKRGLNTTD